MKEINDKLGFVAKYGSAVELKALLDQPGYSAMLQGQLVANGIDGGCHVWACLVRRAADPFKRRARA